MRNSLNSGRPIQQKKQAAAMRGCLNKKAWSENYLMIVPPPLRGVPPLLGGAGCFVISIFGASGGAGGVFVDFDAFSVAFFSAASVFVSAGLPPKKAIISAPSLW